MGTAGRLTLTLPAAVTEGLLRRVAGAFHAGIQHVLLTGLALAIAQWCGRRDREAITAVLIDVEGHGREEVFSDTDLSRTVGWFTSLFPVRLDLCGVDIEEALAGGAALGRALKIIKEQLRGVPHNGLGYGLLRYLNRADGFAACRVCGAADRLQLSRAVCGACWRRTGLVRLRRGGLAVAAMMRWRLRTALRSMR